MTLTVTDIANRALQRVGAKLISKANGNNVWIDTGNSADQVRANYEILRRAELSRNAWVFAIRRTAIRAVDTAAGDVTMLFVPPTWAVGTTYGQNIVVEDSDGDWWISLKATNIGHIPNQTQGVWWTNFIGPQTVSEFNSTANPPNAYYAGEFVYDPNNANAVYMSLVSINSTTPPSSSWVAQTAATVVLPNIIYPVATGPITQLESRNIFFLPKGYLKMAAQDPSAGKVSYLGFPSNLMVTDWEIENGFLITRENQTIALRFSADVSDVTKFHPMFVEGLASRVAFEIAEPLTQSNAKLQSIGAEYKQFMGEARMTNGIEASAVAAPLDDFIAARI